MRNQSTLYNEILARLTPDDLALLSQHFEHVDAPQGTVLIAAGAPVRSVLFPECGVVSIVIRAQSGRGAEAGMIGRDGFIHPALLQGFERLPYNAEVFLPCKGYSISLAALMEAVALSASLRSALWTFARAQMVQATFTCLSYATQGVCGRLARWLLMVRDRIDEDAITLTHDALSLTLAVRRPSVTTAIHKLEGNGLIRSTRGMIVIRNRPALEELASSVYGSPEAIYGEALELR